MHYSLGGFCVDETITNMNTKSFIVSVRNSFVSACVYYNHINRPMRMHHVLTDL